MKKLILLLFLFPVLSLAQPAIRVDQPLQTTGPNVPSSGGPLPQALFVANSTVALCTHPSASYSACLASPIVTYTDSTEATPCAAATPLVLLPGNTCTASSGAAATLGFWYDGGTVDYYTVTSYGTFGPYSVTNSGNGGGGVTPSTTGLTAYYNNAGTIINGNPPANCSAFASTAACIAGAASALIPPGGSSVYTQYSFSKSIPSCYVDSTTQSLVIFPLNYGAGYTGTPNVTVSAGSLSSPGSVTANVVGGQVTSFNIVGPNTGYLPGNDFSTLCPVTISVDPPPTPPTPIPVLDLNRSATSYTTDVRVDDFGCHHDGVTDDTFCFNNAIQYATVSGTQPGTIRLTSGYKYFIGTVTGVMTGAGDDGSVPVASTFTCTSTAGVPVSPCTLTTAGSGLTTNTVTNTAGSGTGATFAPGAVSGGTVATLTMGGSGTGYPASWLVYTGPTCQKVPCTILPPEPIAQIGYSVYIPNFLTIEGNDAQIVGGFTSGIAQAGNYTNDFPFTATFGAPTGGRGSTQTTSHVTIRDLQMKSVFIGFGNCGSYWVVNNVSVSGGVIAQCQNTQYSVWTNINLSQQFSSMTGWFLGGLYNYRAPSTGVNAGNVLNSYNLLDGFNATNVSHFQYPTVGTTQFNLVRRAWDCWWDINFFRVEDNLGANANSDNCYSPPGGVARMTDQDVAAQYTPDDMWRGAYGITVAAYTRYGRPTNGVTLNNISGKLTTSYLAVLGPNNNGSAGNDLSIENGGQCTTNVAYGSVSCPNPYEPQSSRLPSLVLASEAGNWSNMSPDGFHLSAVTRPWQIAQGSVVNQAGDITLITGGFSGMQSGSGTNPVLGFGVGQESAIATYPPRMFQGTSTINADTQSIVLRNLRFDASLFNNYGWVIQGLDSYQLPGNPSVLDLSNNLQPGSQGSAAVNANAMVRAPGMRIDWHNLAGGNITAFTITNGGSGYTPYSFVNCSIAASPQLLPGSGSVFYNADCGARTDVNGSVIQVWCTRCGVGYTSAPAVTITAPSAGVTATATATVSVIDPLGEIQHWRTCSFFLNAGGTVASNSSTTLGSISCLGATFSAVGSRGDWVRVIANGGSVGPNGLIITGKTTALNTISLTLSNPTTAGITYAAGTATDPWIIELISGNFKVNLNLTSIGAVTPTVTTASPYLAGGGGGSLPSCILNNLIYYAGAGTTGTCLTLGTNLSITTGTLNASSTGATNFNALTSGTNTAAAMLVGTGASLGTTGSGTIAATTATTATTAGAVPFSGITSSTNTTAAMVVGTGSSLNATGSGSIAASTVPFSGVQAGTFNGGGLVVGLGGSLSASGGGTIAATSVTGLSGLTTGVIPKATGVASLGNSALDDGITTANTLTYTGTAGVAAPSYATNGAANGNLNMTSTGTPPSGAASNTLQLTVPNAVTPYTLTFPGAAPASNGQMLTATTAGVGSWTSPAVTSLTTTGSSGAATLIAGVLNIPNYAGGSSLPSGTTGQGLYYATGGTTVTATSDIIHTGTAANANIGFNVAVPLNEFDFAGTTGFLGTGPTSDTTSNGAFTSGATTFSVVSTTGYPSSGILLIGASNFSPEFLSYTGTSGGNTFTGLTRSLYGTTAAASQSTGTTVVLVSYLIADNTTVTPKWVCYWKGDCMYAPSSNDLISSGITSQSSLAVGGVVYASSLVVGGSAGGAGMNAATNGVQFFNTSSTTIGALNSTGTLTTTGNSTTLTSPTSITSLTLVTTGLVMPTVPSVTGSVTYRGRCSIIWEQSTGVNTVTFGIGASAAPTDLYVMNTIHYGLLGVTSNDLYTTITSNTATNISQSVAPGATGSGYKDEIDFTLINPTTTANTITIYGLTGNASDALVIEPGSSCEWLP